MNQFARATKAPLIGGFVNALLAAIKISGGILGHSYALVADGIESAADVVSSLVVWGGLRYSIKPADENHPYGHGKAESLAAVGASLALLFAALMIAVESIKLIITPHTAPRPFTLAILAGVIVAKSLLSRFVSSVGERVESTALKSDALHHFSDALTSTAAFIGISIALIGGHGYEAADDWAALVACIVIFYNGIRLLKEAINDVMDASVSAAYEDEIRAVSKSVPGVVDIEKCRIRKSGLQTFIEIHVVVDGDIPVRVGHEIGHRVKDALLASKYRVADVSVHIEPH
jgi:cation diffusion facilitator family transporter